MELKIGEGLGVKEVQGRLRGSGEKGRPLFRMRFAVYDLSKAEEVCFVGNMDEMP
jgi:hypothetical protein